MTEDKHCNVCGKETRKFLFKDGQMKVYICSRKCELEYFETLRGRDRELQAVLLYLDEKIDVVKKLELGCWITALVGIIIVVLSIFFANVPIAGITGERWQLVGALFLIGIVPLTSSSFILSQVSSEKNKLMEKRRELSLAYSV